MPSHIFAISKDSEAIAKKYGSNVSQGISEMERLIEQKDFDIKVLVERDENKNECFLKILKARSK